MTTMKYHPETGIRYCVVIPQSRGPFIDVRMAYDAAARTRPWLEILTPEAFCVARTTEDWLDPNICFVLWHDIAGTGLRATRKAKLVEVYAEAIGPEEIMLEAHRAHRDRFRARAEQLDGVIVHTPRMAEYMRSHSYHAYVVPAGWDSVIPWHSRRPYVDRSKKHAFWGSMVGLRPAVVDALQSRMHDGITSLTGLYGASLLCSLACMRSALYIPHSEVWSFSTWRIWQSIASGTPMTIPRYMDGTTLDIWPMQPSQCVEMPWSYGSTEWSADVAAKDLAYVLADDSMDTARVNMMDGLYDKFRIGRVVDEWLVPACAAVKGPAQ